MVATAAILSGALPVFLTVSCCARLFVPTFCPPKWRLAGLRLTTGAALGAPVGVGVPEGVSVGAGVGVLVDVAVDATTAVAVHVEVLVGLMVGVAVTSPST